MRTTNYLTKLAALAIAGAVAGTLSARASIDMTLTGVQYSATDVGVTGNFGSGSANNFNLAPGGYWIGVYTFTVDALDATGPNLTADNTGAGSSGLTVGTTFSSVCLSPSGDLDFGDEHSYNYESLASGATAANPPTWASGSEGDAGIQNTMYLWRLFNSSVKTGAEGAGLAEAMYEVLYNSTAYGQYSATGPFAPSWGAGAGPGAGTAEAYYNDYLSYFAIYGSMANSLGVADNVEQYGMLVPDPENSSIRAGQEFIISSSNLTPVPEASTLIAGGLLLLPFGATATRFFRRNRAA